MWPGFPEEDVDCEGKQQGSRQQEMCGEPNRGVRLVLIAKETANQDRPQGTAGVGDSTADREEGSAVLGTQGHVIQHDTGGTEAKSEHREEQNPGTGTGAGHKP